MKTLTFFKILLCGIFVCFESLVFAVTYNVIDLGTMDGKFRKIAPAAINDNGQVVGNATFGDGSEYRSESFIYDSGSGIRVLPSLGGKESYARDINDNGYIVGQSNGSAYFWEGGSLVSLGPGNATGISNSGIVVGSTFSQGSFVWSKNEGAITVNDFDTRISGVNEKGQAVGFSRGASYNGQSFVWTQEDGINYLTLGSFQRSIPSEINELEEIAGTAWDSTNSSFPVLWKEGSVERLGNERGSAFAINDLSQVVGGIAGNEGYDHGFIWDREMGLVDLNTLVVSGHGFQLIGSATDINSLGQIVAFAYTDLRQGIYHAVLLDPVFEGMLSRSSQPVPEPATMLLVGIGMSLLAVLRKRCD